MTRATLSEFSNAVDDIKTYALYHHDATLFVGRWALGQVVNTLDFEGIKPLVPPPKATERQRKDYKAASMLQGLKPRWAFDDFLTGRQQLVDFFNEQHRLELLGYTGEALRLAIQRWATKRTDSREDPVELVLGKAVSRIYGFLNESAALYYKLSRDYGGFEENDAQSAAYDLALVDNFKKMDPTERASWLAVTGRPDGKTDKRMLAALSRVPPMLTGLSDQELSEIRSAYFRGEWPQTATAMVTLSQAVGAAHDSLRTSVNTIVPYLGKTAKELPNVTDECAEWLIKDFDHSYSFEPPTIEE